MLTQGVLIVLLAAVALVLAACAVLTFSPRWLSGKLSDTVSKTKENTDDIKILNAK